MAERLASFLSRRRWFVTAAWVLLLAVSAVVSAPLADKLSGGGWTVAGSDSAAVAAALEDGFVGRGPSSVTVVVHDTWYDAGQPGFDARVTAALDEIAARPDLEVESRVGYASTTGQLQQGFLGSDTSTAVETLGLRLPDGTARQVLPDVQAELEEIYAAQGLDVSLVGTASFWGEVNKLSEEGLAHAELLTLPLILLVLVMIFRGVVAALVALSVGITAILATFAVLTVIAGHYELSLFVQNTATMLGLGVGIDYSLFVISRFKEELGRGRSVDEALAETLRHAGETVFFSGLTIVAAMSTLFLVPLGVIASISLGAILVVAFSVLAALLVLPVLLRLLGHRIGRLPGDAAAANGRHARRRTAQAASAGRWERATARVMRRPVAFLGVALAGLLLLAAPAVGLETFTPDAQIVPASSPVRQGFERMQDEFGAGSTSPIRVLVEGEELAGASTSDAVTDLAQRLEALPGVDRVESALPLLTAVSPDRPLAALAPSVRDALPVDTAAVIGHYVSDDATRLVLEVVPSGHASDPATRDLLEEVRDVAADTVTDAGAGLGVIVGGETAEGVESNAVIADSMPQVVGAMLLVIYVLLLITFRSVLLPLKAIAMNLVSVGATFGVLTLVFQHGFGVSLLGVDGTSAIQNFVPVLLLTLLFSLSTDYEVFLLNRVREEYRASGDNTASVASGMASTAPLISGAALLMVVVFGAFALVGLLPIKQLGFGMAVAIALDATLVRLVVVPASMRLLGDLNWWAPRLRGRHPSLPAPVRQPVTLGEPS